VAATAPEGAAASASAGPCDDLSSAFPDFDGRARFVAVLCCSARDGLADDVADDDGVPGVDEGAWPGPPD
jgi:hypothetical protein